jgi:hypothetical protein
MGNLPEAGKTRDEGRGARDEGRWTKDEGRGMTDDGRLRSEDRGQKSVDRRLLNVCWSLCLNHVLYAIGFLYIIRWRWLVVQLIFNFFNFFLWTRHEGTKTRRGMDARSPRSGGGG